jgi:hypothetical protein
LYGRYRNVPHPPRGKKGDFAGTYVYMHSGGDDDVRYKT